MDKPANSSVKFAAPLSCGTSVSELVSLSTKSPSILSATVNAVSTDYAELYGSTVSGLEGGIEAQRADGTWAGIAIIKCSCFLNSAAPTSYFYDSDHFRLRLSGDVDSELLVPVRHIILNVSSRRNEDGTVHVSGSSTMQSGAVEASAGGVWMGIGIVDKGLFSNPRVPSHYLYSQDTLRLRVNNHVASSRAIDSTLAFPQSRSIHFSATSSAEADANLRSLRHAKADYQPTGFFAPKDQDVEVWAAGNVSDTTLLVGIQGMADRDAYAEQSPDMRATRLVRGLNIIRDPHGGIIHLRHLSAADNNPVRIIIGGSAVPVPYYVKGNTLASQWHEMLNTSQSPEVELVGPSVVVAAFRKSVLKFPQLDPLAIIDSHERVVTIQNEISGLDGSTPVHTAKLRIYAVESRDSAAPYATAAYIGIPTSVGINEYSEALYGGKADSWWVTLHEYGHHHQNRVNGQAPLNEVSVNLYALAVGRVIPNNYSEEFPRRWPATREWLAKPRSEKQFNLSPDPQALFEQLRKGLSAGFLTALDRYIRENPVPTPSLTDFIVSASVVGKCNLCNFFADWGLLKEDDTSVWEAVAELGLPVPTMNLTEIRPYID